ncbi:hypothetical protein D9M71_528680 [compost metagenome]
MVVVVGPPTGKRCGDQATEGVGGAPQTQYTATFARAEEAADVLAQARPAGGLGKALDQHAGGENRQGGVGAHEQRGQRRDDQPAQYHDPGAEAVGEVAPQELPHGIRRQVEGVEIGHHGFFEHEVRVFANTQFRDGKRLAGEVESGIRHPGNQENLHTPTLERFPAGCERTCSVLVHGVLIPYVVPDSAK